MSADPRPTAWEDPPEAIAEDAPAEPDYDAAVDDHLEPLDEACAGCPDCEPPTHVPDPYSNDCRRDDDPAEEDEARAALLAAHDRAITEHRRRTAYGS